MIARHHSCLSVALAVALACCCTAARAQQEKGVDLLKVGDTAPDVSLQPLEGNEQVKLSSLTKDGPVVLVVLRGYPGYQCPICFRQVGDLIRHADEFERLGAKVVLVYPGPADELSERAHEFLRDIRLPEPFVMMIDPDYAFTNLYHLRWDEPRETAYPSTFVLDPDRKVTFRTISFSHGGRAKADDVLAAVKALPHAGAAANK
jgi:thioredoxin-dependent peroxiredoxin